MMMVVQKREKFSDWREFINNDLFSHPLPPPFSPTKKSVSDCKAQPFQTHEYCTGLRLYLLVFILIYSGRWTYYMGPKAVKPSTCIYIFSHSLPSCASVIIYSHLHGPSFGECLGLSIELPLRVGLLLVPGLPCG